MIVFKDVQTQIGRVSSELVKESEFEAWKAEHPECAILATERFLMVMYQKTSREVQ